MCEHVAQSSRTSPVVYDTYSVIYSVFGMTKITWEKLNVLSDRGKVKIGHMFGINVLFRCHLIHDNSFNVYLKTSSSSPKSERERERERHWSINSLLFSECCVSALSNPFHLLIEKMPKSIKSHTMFAPWDQADCTACTHIHTPLMLASHWCLDAG